MFYCFVMDKSKVLFLLINGSFLFLWFQHDHNRSIFVGNLPFGESTDPFHLFVPGNWQLSFLKHLVVQVDLC